MILNKLRVADHGPLSDIVRNRKFESISLQQRVRCEPASSSRRRTATRSNSGSTGMAAMGGLPTFTNPVANGEDAPIPAVRATMTEPLESTLKRKLPLPSFCQFRTLPKGADPTLARNWH